MATFRVEKNADFTVMSNHHLRNSKLSLRAKGLLSQILSLPEDWDYTIAGLAAINREGKDAIRSAIQELESEGYIERRQTAGPDGKFSTNEYIVHEHPVSAEPLSGFPTTGKPSTEKPLTENPTELNKDISSKEEKKKKSKKEKAEPEPLSNDQLWQLARDGIVKISKPWWSSDQKNEIHKLIMEVYDPTRDVRRAHPIRSARSVELLFTNLGKRAGNDPVTCIALLSDVIQNGWQNVSAPKGNPSESPTDPAEYF